MLMTDVPVFPTPDPLAEKYYWISPYAYCGNNPVNRIDPTGMDWYTDKDGTYQYDPDITKDSKLEDGQTYVGVTHQVKDANGNVIENYRKDGSIMFTSEESGYRRIWNNTQTTGKEEMGVITKKGVLVLPSYKNNASTATPEVYDYSWENGSIKDADGNSFKAVGTMHTHPELATDMQGNVVHGWMGPSREDFDYFGTKTPNVPFYVVTADGVVHANIPLTPNSATPLILNDKGGKGKHIAGLVFGHYSLKNIK
jgi:hypothetical protein